MAKLGILRRFFAVATLLIGAISGSALGQTPLPGTTPTAVTPLWYTITGTGKPQEGYSTPDGACRRQHQVYNPNATYQAPKYDDYNTYICRWDTSAPGASTILPAWVTLQCPNTHSLTPNGECRTAADDEPECDCTEESRPEATGPSPIAGNPISIATGSKIDYQSDFETADGLFKVGRSYRSLQHQSRRQSNTPIPGFGPNWHGVLPGRLAAFGTYTEIVEYLPASGGYDYFSTTSTSTDWVYAPGRQTSLSSHAIGRRKFEIITPPSVTRNVYFRTEAAVPNGAAEFKLTESDGTQTFYRRANSWSTADQLRYLIPIQRIMPGGYTLYYDYPDVGEFPDKVRDSFGREMLLTWAVTKPSSIYQTTSGGGGGSGGGTTSSSTIYYEAPNLTKVITQIQLPDTTKLVYTYGETSTVDRVGRDDRLTRVSRQDVLGNELWAREYLYEDGNWPYALTGIVDQDGQRLSTYTYHPNGLAKTSERAGGVGKVEVDYTTDRDNTYEYTYRSVKNPLGRQENYHFFRRQISTLSNIPSSLTRIEGLATADVPADLRTFNQAASGSFSYIRQLTSTTDPRGVVTNFTNDTANSRPTAITEGVGTSAARTRNIQWHATLDLPTRIDVPGLRTEMTYGTDGELLTRTLTDTTTHTLPYSTAGQTRTETYTWGTGGRLASINGPRAAVGAIDDITSFSYDATGNLLTMTNGLGQVTAFAGHDVVGRPGSMTDPNGIQTLFAYDPLGRLLTSTVKHPVSSALDAVTTYDYDVEGRVTGITLPATEKLSFVYDLAGQLLEIASADGEKQTFAHDAMGNVTEQKIKRADGVARSTITRTFDSIGRMLTETLGSGRTTAWEYDKNGNPVRTTSPRSYATDLAFDPLNRLTQAVAPDTGTTATAYNAKDEPTSFTDAVSVQTTFVRNGFGEVIREVSPDRGTSTYYYDAAGDMTAAIDGRGQRIDYTRDILGRVTSKTPVGRPSSEIVTYTYDSGGVSGCYCVGRLASMTDGSGTTSFGYDHRGNLTSKAEPVGTLAWTYDLADRVVQVGYPSGRDVGYTRDAKGRVIEVKTRATSGSSWSTLATNITYEPFGPMKSADLGNGLKLSLDWGSDRRLASKRLYTAGGADVWHLTYAYDGDDNITAITDLVTSANSRSFGYDSVDRLTRVDSGGAPFAREDYVHDKNGNRAAVQRRTNVADTAPAETDTYTRTSGTNRIASVAPAGGGTRGFTHDARGNLIGETRPGGPSLTLGYDGHARLASYAVAGAETQAMLYNGLDERVGLTTTLGGSPVAERRYIYDADHRIIGEYGTTTADLRAEYIWILPEVGDASPFGGDDGLGGYMPLAVAIPDGATSKIQWVQGNHLGTPVVTTDATGAVISPSGYDRIGFPGQVEQHADLYYNYYRDYDQTLGRYVQADPIGLEGGSNPYLYAEGNPLVKFDPFGTYPENIFPLNSSNPADVRLRASAERSKKIYDRPNELVFFGHGANKEIQYYDELYDARNFYDRVLKYHPAWRPGMPVTLYACDTGNGFAQALANIIRAPVRAPTAWAYYDRQTGRIEIWEQGFGGKGKSKVLQGKRHGRAGEMKTFYPK
ncbi:RHS repeat protein [Sphingopyxis sp. BSN-002]|uniref:RHS repeat-associated core domain-containing protein n=1 Tax=Sphingopyxis sp. BSN-002 TaxID=2911495 RepID=UPI001EDB87D3|nr:RHS repeat-associated core domain-containing protein [Sphingopyxis sp. BSN-002]UKK86175.1 RHS repeat protein [Sphingopyxis sp. BSN-002]